MEISIDLLLFVIFIALVVKLTETGVDTEHNLMICPFTFICSNIIL